MPVAIGATHPITLDLMWRVLQAKTPGDYVGATGESHTVREFVHAAFEAAGVKDGERHLRTDPKFNRPSEVFNLRGNASKAKRELDWAPKTRFRELVRVMVAADMERYGKTLN